MYYYETIQQYGKTCTKCPYNNDLFQDEYSWCDKVGGKHYIHGWCTDCVFQKEPFIKKRRKKRLNKYFRNKKYKNRLRKLCNDVDTYDKSYANSLYYPVSMKLRDYDRKTRSYTQIEKPYPKIYTRGNHGSAMSVHYKSQSNRIIRRYKGEIPKGNWCHKMYDFWWNMY